MNQSIERRELTLAINEVETACDVSIAVAACTDYGLQARKASEVFKQVESAIAGWREEASRIGIPEAEQNLMAEAFGIDPTGLLLPITSRPNISITFPDSI
jgi:hypothetical protein